jgi:hypothetical protein
LLGDGVDRNLVNTTIFQELRSRIENAFRTSSSRGRPGPFDVCDILLNPYRFPTRFADDFASNAKAGVHRLRPVTSDRRIIE